MITGSGLLVDQVAGRAGQLELGVAGVDGPVLQGGLQLQLVQSSFPHCLQDIAYIFLGVEEGEEILDELVKAVALPPLDIHPLLR